MNADERGLPLEREGVLRSTAFCISDPHDCREIVFACGLLLDEDLAATALLSQPNSDASIRKRIPEVRLPIVVRRAANRLDVSRAAANSDSHIILNAATPGHAPAAITGVRIIVTATPTSIELALDVAQQALNVVPVSSLDITAINGTREVLKYVEGVAQILDAPAVD